MKEIMVAYWSGTGNTAAMATILGKGIQDGGATAKVVSVEDIKADDLKDYPVFALGQSFFSTTSFCKIGSMA